MEEYSLSDSYLSVNGGGMVPDVVDKFAYKWVGGHYLASFAIIIFLSLVVVWFMWKAKEGFNPTQNLRDQDSDQFGLGSREHMAAAPAQAAVNQPGSLAWQVLNSSDFNCANRKDIGEDAWGWMSGVAKEGLSVGKPKNDNDFSKVLAGN
jgi:hypothetical protein